MAKLQRADSLDTVRVHSQNWEKGKTNKAKAPWIVKETVGGILLPHSDETPLEVNRDFRCWTLARGRRGGRVLASE